MSNNTAGLGIGIKSSSKCYTMNAIDGASDDTLGEKGSGSNNKERRQNFIPCQAPEQAERRSTSPEGCPTQQNYCSAEISGGLDRHGTLLSVGAPPGRNAAELNAILGSSNARLRSGATLLPPPGQRLLPKDRTAFEQARTKARVELDLVPYSNICVQGGQLHGSIKITIRTRKSHKEPPMMITDGKVRLIGFECISNEKERYPFYQCSARLSEAAPNFSELFESPPDTNGFYLAREGDFNLPFSMHIPISAEYGLPKGLLMAQAGVAIRYIAMVSIKCKEFGSDKPSVAHFYRNCEVWPRLNPATVLAPNKDPVTASSTKSSFMSGGGKVGLNATLHRSCWVAGQLCTVRIFVNNDTKKIVKGVTLALLRSIIVFKPHRRLDTLIDGEYIADPDACQTFTSHKQVAESTLEMGQRASGTRHQVSAKGWWAGVYPGERKEFSYCILLPQTALTIRRSQLLEVNYSLQVTLHGGPLQTLDAQVNLPIRIINFISIDPPPTSLPFNLTVPQISTSQHMESGPIGILGESDPGNDTEMALEKPIISLDSVQEFGQDIDDDDDQNVDGSACRSVSDSDQPQDYSEILDAHGPAAIGEPEDYTDEDEPGTSNQAYDAVQLFVDPDYENPPRFADLYYRDIQEKSLMDIDAPTVSDSQPVSEEHYINGNESELPWPPIEPSTLRRQPNTVRSRPRVPSELCMEGPQASDNCGKDLTATTGLDTEEAPGQHQDPDCNLPCLGKDEMGLQADQNNAEGDLTPSTGSQKGLNARALPKPPSLVPESTSSADDLNNTRDSQGSYASASTASKYSNLSFNLEHSDSDSETTQKDVNTGMESPGLYSSTGKGTSMGNPNRPTLSVLGRTASGASRITGSAQSVKDRIRELEERQKVLEIK